MWRFFLLLLSRRLSFLDGFFVSVAAIASAAANSFFSGADVLLSSGKTEFSGKPESFGIGDTAFVSAFFFLPGRNFFFSSAFTEQAAFHMLMPVHILPVPIEIHTGKSTPECTVYK
jgi:hypothetical protein